MRGGGSSLAAMITVSSAKVVIVVFWVVGMSAVKRRYKSGPSTLP